jgi:hypothetical protein
VTGLAIAAALAVSIQPVPFEVASVSEDLRTVSLAYETGPCWQGDRHLVVQESRRVIRVILEREHIDGCTARPSYRRFAVRLRRPVGGRRIEGAPRIERGLVALQRRTAPRVIDLNLGDAQRAAAVQGFRTRPVGRPHGTVAFQSPLPNTRAADDIRLTVGRGLFRRRALGRCAEGAGARTRTVVPKPGDADAPDLELQVGQGQVGAFVAFYADPVRARELAPAIRRNARRFDGIVERRRHVTIVWTARPPAELRDRVHRCAYGRLGRPRP